MTSQEKYRLKKALKQNFNDYLALTEAEERNDYTAIDSLENKQIKSMDKFVRLFNKIKPDKNEYNDMLQDIGLWDSGYEWEAMLDD